MRTAPLLGSIIGAAIRRCGRSGRRRASGQELGQPPAGTRPRCASWEGSRGCAPPVETGFGTDEIGSIRAGGKSTLRHFSPPDRAAMADPQSTPATQVVAQARGTASRV